MCIGNSFWCYSHLVQLWVGPVTEGKDLGRVLDKGRLRLSQLKHKQKQESIWYPWLLADDFKLNELRLEKTSFILLILACTYVVVVGVVRF